MLVAPRSRDGEEHGGNGDAVVAVRAVAGILGARLLWFLSLDARRSLRVGQASTLGLPGLVR